MPLENPLKAQGAEMPAGDSARQRLSSGGWPEPDWLMGEEAQRPEPLTWMFEGPWAHGPWTVYMGFLLSLLSLRVALLSFRVDTPCQVFMQDEA